VGRARRDGQNGAEDSGGEEVAGGEAGRCRLSLLAGGKRMARKRSSSFIFAGLALSLAACGREPVRGPSHDTVVPLLQQEAAYLKKGGEDLDPSLGKVTWTVEGLDVSERPGDKDFPWAGSIRFRIHDESRDYDGNVTSNTRQKRFDYRYSTAVGKWLIDVPPTATP
jgi:hypothetical protein